MTLYLVATPIGNLSDMTPRAIDVLCRSAYILCEDTRHSRPLLSHFAIDRPLVSYHKFNEAEREEQILTDLTEEKEISLIADAGTPAISDPGERLVKKCRELSVKVVPIPGACAAITALCASGLMTARFQFIGFLPRKEHSLRRLLLDLLSYEGTTICYESPYRLKKVLQTISEIAPDRIVTVAREMTKKFEEFVTGTAGSVEINAKGECVLLIAPAAENERKNWAESTPEQHVQHIQSTYQLSKKEAIKIVANLRSICRRDLYKQLVKSEGPL